MANWFQRLFGWTDEKIAQFEKEQRASNSRFVQFLNGAGDPEGNPFVSLVNKYTGAGLTGAEIAANRFNAEQAQIQRDYEERMSNTVYQRGVTDMKAAGLNPALMYGSGGAASIPSGSSASSVGLGSSGGLLDLILQLKSLNIQEKLANADIRQKNANASKTEAEIPWIDVLNGLDQRSRELGNSLSEEQIANMRKTREQIQENIKKTIQETNNVVLQGLLLNVQKNLSELNFQQQAEMFEYDKALKQAQTDAQKAQAAAAYAKAAIDRGLLDAGIVEKTIGKYEVEIKSLSSEADRRAAEAAIAQWKTALRTGNLPDTVVTTGIPKVDSWLNQHVFGPLFSSIYSVGDMIGSPLAGIIK